MLDELETQAHEYYAAGEYTHALADYSVLREARARHEGPYSVKYLHALHCSVRCMRHLKLWQDTDLLCRELHAKYVRTHGRGEADTVDVAKHWAWAMVQLGAVNAAVSLYLVTADAVWETDTATARTLLRAAAAYAPPADDPLAGLTLTHTTELADSMRSLHDLRRKDGTQMAPSLFDGAI